jgi:hypothetical protein
MTLPRNMTRQTVYCTACRLIIGLTAHVKLSVNLESLPPEAWETRRGVSGKYRRVRYHLGLSFGPGGIEWRFLYEGKVIGSVECEYS